MSASLQATREFLSRERNSDLAPAWYKTMDDETLYHQLQKAGRIPVQYRNDYFSSDIIESHYNEETEEAKSDPMGFLGNAMDYFIDEDSADWLKAAYVNSLTGATEQLITGKARYNVNQADFSIWEDIGAGLFSFFMPLDLLTLWGGGKIGKGIVQGFSKGGSGLGQKLVQKNILKKYNKEIVNATKDEVLAASLTTGQKALLGGVGSAPALALYEGAMGGIMAKNNGEDPLSAAMWGVFHGGVMGFITGGIGGGMGAKAAAIKNAANKGKGPMSFGDKMKVYGVYGKPASTVLEASVFTGSEIGQLYAFGSPEERAEFDAAPGHEILRMFSRNMGLFSALKITHRGTSAAKDYGKETSLYKRTAEHLKAIRDSVKDEVNKPQGFETLLRNVKDTVESQKNIKDNKPLKTPEVDEALGTNNKKINESIQWMEKTQEKLDRLDELLSKGDKESIEKEYGEIDYLIKEMNQSLKELEGQKLDGVELNISEQLALQNKELKAYWERLEVEVDKKKAEWISENKKPQGPPLSERGLRKKNIHPKRNEEIFDLEGYDLSDPEVRRNFDKQIDEYLVNERRKQEDDKRTPTQKALDIDASKIIKDSKQSAAERKRQGENETNTQRAIRKIDEGFTNFDKEGTPETNKNYGKLDAIDNVHRNILLQVYGEKNARSQKNKNKAIEESIEFLNYVKEKFGKDITQLEKGELYNLSMEYISDKVHGQFAKGRDRLNLRANKYETQAKGAGYSRAEFSSMIKEAGRVRDALRELDKESRINVFTKEGAGIISGTPAMKKFTMAAGQGKKEVKLAKINPESGKEMTLEEVIEDLAVQAEKLPEKETIKFGKKELSGKDAAFIIRKTREHLLRGNELPNIAQEHIEIGANNKPTGQILVGGKGEGSQRYINDVKLAEFLMEYAEKHKITSRTENIIFKKGEFHKFLMNAAKNAGVKVNVYHGVEDKMYPWEKGLRDELGKPVTGGKISIADIFRKISSEGQVNLYQEAKKRGHKGGAETQGRLPISIKKYQQQPTTTSFTKEQLKIKEFEGHEGEQVQYKKKKYTLEGLVEVDGVPMAKLEGVKNPVEFASLKKLLTKEQVQARDLRIETSEERQKAIAQHFEKIPEYENIRLKLEKDLGKAGGKKVLGRITNHLIEILEGKSREDTIPHEYSHYVVDVLKGFGTIKDKALIKRGIQLFAKDIKRKNYKSESEFRKAQEETLVQRIGEVALAEFKMKEMGLKPLEAKDIKGLKGKFKYFMKKFWGRVKEVFGLQSKNDIAYMLGRKVFTGKGVPTGTAVKDYINKLHRHYQVDDKGGVNQSNIDYKKAANAKAHAIQNSIESSLQLEGKSPREIKAELNAIKELAGIPTKKKWSPKDSAIDSSTLDLWVDALIQKNKEVMNNTNEITEFAKGYSITRESIQNLARSLGRIDGDFTKLTEKNKEVLKLLIKEIAPREEVMETAADQSLYLNSKTMPYVKKVVRGFMPVYYVLREYGGTYGRRIADKIVNFEYALNHEFKGKGHEASHIIQASLGKGQEHVWMWDRERLTNFLGEGGKLNHAEQLFLKNSRIKGRPEYKAKQVHKELMNYYWQQLYKEVSKINSKISIEQFKKEFGPKFVKDYFTRRVTKKALEHIDGLIDVNEKGEVFGDALDKAIQSSAKAKAEIHADKFNPKVKGSIKKKMGNKKYQKDYIREFENLKDKKHKSGEKHYKDVVNDMYNMLTHQHHRVKNSSLMDRGPILPEYIVITNKRGNKQRIRTYETSYRKTVDPYISSMSKYLATVRYFPEFTGLGSKYKLITTNADQVKLLIKQGSMGEYAYEAIKRIVGVNEGHKLLAKEHSIIQGFTHFSAGAGLSSPTSGFKNLMIGMPRNMASFGVLNTAKAMMTVASSPMSAWSDARRKGAIAYGAKTMELGQTPGRVMERIFRWNLMTQTENINRVVAMEAGKLYFAEQLNIMAGERSFYGMGNKYNAKRLFKDMWRLSEKEIKLIESGEYALDVNAKAFEAIIGKVEHYSHVSSQGGTSLGNLPLWASGPMAKSFTLFQRMAYSTTFDSYVNYAKPLFTHLNPFPLFRAAVGHSLSGAALYGAYKHLFKIENPTSSGETVDKLLYNVWKSEMLGLGGFVLDPYNKGDIKNIMYPVIVRNAGSLMDSTRDWLGGRRSFGQSVNKFAKETIVQYGQYDKMDKNLKSPHWTEARKWSERRRQFEADFGVQADGKFIMSRKNYYYKDLKEALYFGSKKDIVESFMTAYNTIVTELEPIPGSTPTFRHKNALKRIKLSLRSMNPLNVSSLRGDGRRYSMRAAYMKWVKKNYGDKELKKLLQSEKEFHILLRKLERIIRNGDVFNKHSVYASQNLSYEKII